MGSIEKFCDAMRWAADSDQVGYSQSDRWDVVFFGDGEYNADCSSLTIMAAQYAGFDTGFASYSGDLSWNLTERGWSRVGADGNPQKGDILLSDANHVAVWLGDCLAQASIDEHGNIAGGSPGDQTGAEVNTRSYYNYPWDCYLRYDGPEEMEDDEMQAIYKPDGEGHMVWYDGTNLHDLCHPDEMAAVQKFYKQATGRDIPVFEFGTPTAPWAHRFEDAVNHGFSQPHM